MTYRGTAKGRTIELDERLPFPDGQRLSVSVEASGRNTSNGSTARILEILRSPPHLDPSDVDELEQAIHAGRLPVKSSGAFDNGK